MKLVVEINLENDAVQDPLEVARILRESADRWEDMRLDDCLILRDCNGNMVGLMAVDRKN